jgi:hypothetical protein
MGGRAGRPKSGDRTASYFVTKTQRLRLNDVTIGWTISISSPRRDVHVYSYWRDGNRGVIEMGRRPVNGERAMTGAERMRLHRERVRARAVLHEPSSPWGSLRIKTPAQLRRLERDREKHRLARVEAAVIRVAHGGKPTQPRVYGSRVYGRHKLLRDKVMEAVKVMDEQQTAHLLVMIIGEWPSMIPGLTSSQSLR